jgi:diguanylate cyclase (GGDEF)-like protein
MAIQDLSTISDHTIEQLELFTQMPMVIYNEQKLLYVNKFFKDKLSPHDFEVQKDHLFPYFNYLQDHQRKEIQLTTNQGESFWFDIIAKPVLYHNSPAMFAVLIDITDRKLAEKNAIKTTKLRKLIIDISQSILESNDLKVFFNSVLANTLKAIDKSTLGTILILDGQHLSTIASFGYSNEIDNFRILLTESFIYNETNGKLDQIVNITDTEALPFGFPVETAQGDQIFVKSALSAPIYFRKKLYGIINIDSIEKNAFNDDDVQSLQFISNSIEVAITNRLLYEEKAYLSKYDQITGLHNRHFFVEHSEVVLKKAIRYQESFNLVMIDIDNLKQVNDQYGHIIGDKLIKNVSHQLRNDLRESDVFARYGGDEFIGLLFNASYQEAFLKMEQVAQKLKQSPMMHHDVPIMGSISFGISSFPNDGKTINDLIHVADSRMYLYKEKNRT